MQSGDPQFPVTRWSIVMTARGQDSAAEAALAHLCEVYWFPLYTYIRRKGKSAEDAEDLTQAFFTKIIEKDTLASARSERGKLRSFLLGALKNFLSDEWDKARAQKRGGGIAPISIDGQLAEERYAMEPADDSSPDRIFERRWALTVLDRVLTSLRGHYESTGKLALFEELHPFLASNVKGESYREAAEILSMTVNSVRVAVFRMRQRYAAELRAQIAETVEDDSEIAEEIDFLFKAVR